MKYLLDTCSFLWSLNEYEKLSPTVTNIIESENELYLSIISLWEITIKQTIKKINLQYTPSELRLLAETMDIQIVMFDHKDLDILYNLPYYHKDPFDRMIISQAISNDMLLITKDSQIPKYPVKFIW